jgi:integrase
MVTVEIKHMRRVRSKGRTYWYHRRTGERLPEDETARIRRVLEINDGLEVPGRRVKVGSVEAVSNVYLASATFKKRAPATQAAYRARLRDICNLWGERPIADIRRKHVIALQDHYADKPATGDMTVAILRLLMAFAVDREYRPDNPAIGVKKVHKGDDVESYEAWPQWAIDKFLSVHEGTTMALALKMGLYTGQRESDVLGMRWSDIVDGRVLVKQDKTRERIAVKLHYSLMESLAQANRESPIILTSVRHRPFNGPNFRQQFTKAKKEAGLSIPELRLVFHGLRYNACEQLAELGMPPQSIMAITGHKTLAMVAKYSAKANQRLMGDAAMSAWEDHSANAKLENRPIEFGKPTAKRLKNGHK